LDDPNYLSDLKKKNKTNIKETKDETDVAKQALQDLKVVTQKQGRY